MSKETVKQKRREPYCKKVTFSKEEHLFYLGKVHPKIVFAGTTFEKCQVPVAVENTFLFEVKEAEEPGGPFRLSANFYNSQGKLSLQIIDNEWRAHTTNWDLEATGGKITIRDNSRHISLRLVVDLPESLDLPASLIVEKLDMYLLSGFRFFGSPQKLKVEFPDGRSVEHCGNLAKDCPIGILIGSRKSRYFTMSHSNQ